MVGFPFAFVADGWFTSMSIQLFTIELCADLIIYFLFWFAIVLLTKRVWTQLTISTMLTRVFWILAILTISFWTFILTISEKHIKLKRDWDMQVLVTGYKFTWTNKDRPDFSKYDPSKK
jgi:hypothetical protein